MFNFEYTTDFDHADHFSLDSCLRAIEAREMEEEEGKEEQAYSWEVLNCFRL